MNIATRNIYPHISYEVWGYTFAHPVFWERAGVDPDIHIDRNQWDGSSEAEYARDLFWDCISELIVWPSGGAVADGLLKQIKASERRKLEAAAGAVSMF